MQIGGNANATAFFRQHGCSTDDAQQKYNSRAAAMYREKLHSQAHKAMQTHGTKLHITSSMDPQSPPADTKEVDFFKQHEDESLQSRNGQTETPPQPVPVSNGSLIKAQTNNDEDPGIGPSVEAALSTSPTEALKEAETRKPTIGVRKPQSAKKGLGAKKGGLGAKKGLGAQKVKTNFEEIESAAQQRDKDRENLESFKAAEVIRTAEEEEKRIASMKLAYQDLSIDRKKQEEKMKNLDPKKAAQMERLGMGYSGSRGASHSAMSDMTAIEQKMPNSSDPFPKRHRDLDDEFEFIGTGFSTGPPKYDDNPFALKKEDRYSSWTSNNKTSSWETNRFDEKQTNAIEEIPSAKDDDRGRSRKSFDVSGSDEAQKKFGGAKAISSDQFFGGQSDLETRQNLSRFEGSSSISSDDYFGTGSSNRSSSSNYNNYGGAGPDLSEIKEGVRQGVTKVAGKLSNLANGVINSIQEQYG